MRATAQDREASALMGVDMNQTISLTFLLGGALAAAAGVVWGLRFGYVRFDLGFNAGLKAFTAAVARRHRQHHRRRAGRLRHRVHRELRVVARLLALVRVPRLPDPDVRPHLQADRHPRPGIPETGHDRRIRDPGEADPDHASRAHRRLRGCTTAPRRSSSAWRSRRRCSPSCPRSRRSASSRRHSPWYDSFANAGVFVLLAMGLNVVVGLAGLLDLGYAAFFAIGAYTYAYSQLALSPTWTCRSCRCSWWARPSRRSSGSRSAPRPCACAATTSRS